jgi:hypothetical protein
LSRSSGRVAQRLQKRNAVVTTCLVAGKRRRDHLRDKPDVIPAVKSQGNIIMKKVIAVAVLAALAGAPSAFALEPIPGSITYGGQPHTKLQKAPVGSPVYNQFYSGGYDYRETYIIQPDRSLKLVDRHIISIPGDR